MTYPVLYLDFDGVLHHEEVWITTKLGIYIPQHIAPGRSLFEWMLHLERSLENYPAIRIVLSTSWVQVRSYEFAKKHLSPSVQKRMVGATFHNRHHIRRDFTATPRGQQIADDVDRRKPSSWVALDDDANGWPSWCIENLVRCDGGKGLSDPLTIDTLVEKLSRMK